jgi:hypothetical protein
MNCIKFSKVMSIEKTTTAINREAIIAINALD